jgi:hypothetical protein
LFLSGAWVKAEAATDRTALLFEVLSNLLAFEATPLEVLSLRAIICFLTKNVAFTVKNWYSCSLIS